METTESTTPFQAGDEGRQKQTDSDLVKLGSKVVTKFHVLMKSCQIYDSRNVALRQFVQECLRMINAIVEREGSLSLKVVRDDLFLNQQRLRYTVEGFNSFKYLLTQWKKRLIGEVIFSGPLDERTLIDLIYSLDSLEDHCEGNATLLTEQLARKGISSVNVNPLEVPEEEGEVLQKKPHEQLARAVFFETIGTMKEVITQMRGGQHAQVRKLKRVAQKAVQLVMEDESMLLGLAAIKNYDEYIFNHSVNVAIYSLAIGRQLGFPRSLMTDLGTTALLHDIGKSKIPRRS